MKNSKVIVISDLHAPYHDEEALSAVLKYIKKTKPTLTILNGDIFDAYSISSFLRDPKRRILLPEIDTTIKILKRIRKSTKGEIVFLGGNHCDRLQRFITKMAPELDGILSIPTLLKLKELDITYYDPGYRYEYRDIIVTHGDKVRCKSGYTAHAMMDSIGKSVIIGHTHRLGIVYKRQYQTTLFGVEGGCLCKIDNVDYIPGGRPDWCHGFVEVIDGIPYIKRIVNGVIY